jgi:hypothetical protein
VREEHVIGRTWGRRKDIMDRWHRCADGGMEFCARANRFHFGVAQLRSRRVPQEVVMPSRSPNWAARKEGSTAKVSC